MCLQTGTFLKSLGLAALCGFALAHPASAFAADTDTPPDSGPDIVVTGARDLAGVMQKADSATTFGIDKPLVDTPRSVTDISEKLLSRYNIKSVYDFTAIAAGTYTGSFFGVPGAIAIRGNVSDNYFNGFQGIPNYANFPTPVDASSNIEIVRGPPSPIYGAGQVGGYMNFIPKSAQGDKTKYVERITGNASVTMGSYDEKVGMANVSAPIKLSDTVRGGLSVFGKVENSGSYYRGMHPKSQLGQATYSTDIGDQISLSVSYQYMNSDGYLKNIGWNRVTQDLIDNQNYISGSALTKIVAPGASYITKAQYFAKTYGSALLFYAPAYGGVTGNAYTKLDPTTVKTVKLDRRTTFVDPDYDINSAHAHTLYGNLGYTFGNGSVIKYESFYNTLIARNYQSYGFGSAFDAQVSEQRLSYKFDLSAGALRVKSIVGGSYRYLKAHDLGSLDDFALSEDRRDLTVGATADDRFNDPFLGGANYAWATSIYSHVSDLGGFALTDLTYGPLSLTLGGRVDNYKVTSINRGSEVGGVYTSYSNQRTPFSWNSSLTYKLGDYSLYATYARSQALQLSQGGAIDPSLVSSGGFLGGSKLAEAGIKTSQLGGRLFASLDVYEQERSFYSRPATGVATVSAIRTDGVEGELRWLVTKRLGITGTATWQRTKKLATAGNGTFITMPGCLTNAGCTNTWAGYSFGYTNMLGLTNGYYIHSSPNLSGSLFATYDYKGKWGLTGGVTYASETGGFLPGSIRLPAYALVKTGAYVVRGPVRVDVNIDNLFNKLYFLANRDTDANANVLPGVGRTGHVKLSVTF
jgi:iron complex outermembrane receptor protein